MRKLMWFTIGFSCSCVYGAYLMWEENLLALTAIAAVTGIIGWLISGTLKRLPVAPVILLGAALGFLWFWVYDGYYLKPIAELDGVTTDAVIEILDYSYDTDYGTAVDGTSLWKGKTVRLMLYLDEKGVFLKGLIYSLVVSGFFAILFILFGNSIASLQGNSLGGSGYLAGSL